MKSAIAPRLEISMTILSYCDLRARGITYTKTHLRRLWEAGKFPKPFQLAAGGRLHWTAEQIDEHIQARIDGRERS
jgi:predicted DNA-binding transcriptional regulator AlpA